MNPCVDRGQCPAFPTETEGARYLLCEATSILLEASVDFVVVGGWVPVLFHRHRFGHPGTFDLDILLNSPSLDDGSFDAAGEMLLGRGYIRAVKNKFQAHRIMNIAGEDFVFHVDFLNERSPGDAIELVGGRGKFQSIYTPAMKAVFFYNEYRTVPEFPGVRFPSVETFVATKAAAVKVNKRQRDAFDVFVSVVDQETEEFTERWRHLVRRDGLFRDANDTLIEAVDEGDAIKKIQSVLISITAAGIQLPTEVEIRQAFDFLASPSRMRVPRSTWQ